MTFLPAPPNTGIRFRRVDLEGKPEIEARIDNVTQTNRSTTLSKGNVKITLYRAKERFRAVYLGLQKPCDP